MSDDPRLAPLLDKLIDSQATPEEVCTSCPELLPAVRRRWQEIQQVRAELDMLFPSSTGRQEHRPAYPSHDTPLPTLPGYEVKEVLGRGGMGVVYRAWHLRLNRPVALKMLLSGQHASPEELERFLREAEAVAGLRHPNIVQVYDVGDVDGRPYFTMELVEGGNLARKLAEGPAGSPGGGTGGAAGRCDQRGAPERHRASRPQAGQHPAHRRRHTQGDRLWPGPAAGRRRRTDAERRSGGHAELHGPRAGARRQGRDRAGHGRVRPGGNPVRLLTGRPPFRAETATATLQQVLADEPVPPARLNPRMPRDLETICLKCLAKEPHQAVRQRRGTGRRPASFRAG